MNIPNKNSDYTDDVAAFTHFLQSDSKDKLFYSKGYNLSDENVVKVNESEFQYELPIQYDIPFPPVENPKFKFIDLFAGIGGFRLAFQELQGKCVFTSELIFLF